MEQTTARKKSLVTLVIIMLLLPVLIIAAQKIIELRSKADTKPSSVGTSNIGVNHFAIGWFTSSSVVGKVRWGTSKDNLTHIASDDRGDVAATAHLVGVDIASPSAQASFRIKTNSVSDRCLDPNVPCVSIWTATPNVAVGQPATISWDSKQVINVKVFDKDNTLISTAVAGNRTFTFTTPGVYYFDIGATDFNGNFVEDDLVSITVGQGNQTVVYSVSGTVTDDTAHAPVPGVVLYATGTPAGQVTSGNDGGYAMGVTTLTGTNSVCIQTMPPGYTLTPQLQATGGCLSFSVTANNQVFREDFQLHSTLPPKSSIGGTIINGTTNQTIPGVTVSINAVSVQSNANGNYQFTEVPQGTYSVCVQVPNGLQTQTPCQSVSVPPTITTLNFTLTAVLSTISGRVFDTQTQAGIAGASVVANGTTLRATADGNGVYTIQAVPPGNYSICVDVTAPTQNYTIPSCQQVSVPPNATGKDFGLTALSTPTPTPTVTPTPTPSPTPTLSPTPSPSPTATATVSPTPSGSGSSSPTPSATASPSPSPSCTPSQVASVKPTKVLGLLGIFQRIFGVRSLDAGCPSPTPSGSGSASPTTSGGASASPAPTEPPLQPGFQRIYYKIDSGGDLWGGSTANPVINGPALFIDIPTTISGATPEDQCGNIAVVANCPDVAFGKVMNANGQAIANAAVFINIKNQYGQISEVLTAVTNDAGTFTVDLGNATMIDVTKYITYNRLAGDTLGIFAVTQDGRSRGMLGTTSQDKPLPDIVLGNATATPNSTNRPSTLPSGTPAPTGSVKKLTIVATMEGQAPANQIGPALLTNNTTGQTQIIAFPGSTQGIADASNLTVGQIYSFTLKGYQHLSVTRSAQILPGTTTINFGTLTAGDIAPALDRQFKGEDDLIEVLDYSNIKVHLNTQDFFSDLNGNGVVDVVDFSILKNNFEKKGDALKASGKSK